MAQMPYSSDDPYQQFLQMQEDPNNGSAPYDPTSPGGMVANAPNPLGPGPGGGLPSRSNESPRDLFGAGSIGGGGGAQGTSRLKTPGRPPSAEPGADVEKDPGSPTPARPRSPVPAAGASQMPVFPPMPPPSGITSLLKSRPQGMYGEQGGLMGGGLGVPEGDNLLGGGDNISALLKVLLQNG